MHTRSRRASFARHALMEACEARQLLAFSGTFNDVDGDVFNVVITGPGTVTTMQAGGEGLRLLATSGTTASSDLRITRQTSVANGELAINAITITGDLDELVLDHTTLREESGQTSAVNVSGRARVVNVDHDVIGTDITISGTGNNNHTTFFMEDAFSEDILQQGLGNGRVNITSGGIIDAFTANFVDFVTVSARRIGDVVIHNEGESADLQGPGSGLLGSDLDLFASDAGAPYGIKTIRVDGFINHGNWFSNSPVQSIVLGGVTEGEIEVPSRGKDEFGEIHLQVNGRLGSLKATLGSLNGDFGAASFGAIEVADDLFGQIDGFTGLNPLGESDTAGIDSLRADRILDLDVHATGGIKQVVAGGVNNLHLDAGWIGTFTVNGGPSGNGSMVSSELNLDDTNRARALDKLTVANSLSLSEVNVFNNNVGTITLGGLFGSNIRVGIAEGASVFTDANPFAFTRTIDAVILKAVAGDPFNFVDSSIAAFNISKLTSTARINTANAGTPLGIVANELHGVSLRRANNSIFTSTDTSLDDPDFHIRVI